MGVFKPPIDKVTIADADTLNGKPGSEYADYDGTTHTSFSVNKPDINTYSTITSILDYPDPGCATSTVNSKSHTQISMQSYADSECLLSTLTDPDGLNPVARLFMKIEGVNPVYRTFEASLYNDTMGLYLTDSDNNKSIEIHTDGIKLLDGPEPATEYEFWHEGNLDPSSFATTGDVTSKVTYHGSAASAPSEPAVGDEYYNTGDSKFYKYNGSSWIALN